MTRSDPELMVRVQHGEQGAFTTLAGRHERTLRLHLLRYVTPEDADDLLQETLYRLWHRAGQWDGRGSPLAWLLRIATNLALNHRRDHQGRALLPLTEGDEDEHTFNLERFRPTEGPTARSADELSDLHDQATRLLELVAELPADKQRVLCMARMDGMKLKDIAQALALPLGTVKSRLHSATQWLTDRWEDE